MSGVERMTAKQAAEAIKAAKKRRHKYNAKRVFLCSQCGGAPGDDRAQCRSCRFIGPQLSFDSTAEANKWGELRILVNAGKIYELRRQVPFDLHANGGAKIGVYVADLTYSEITRSANGPLTTLHVLDVKGVMTALARWKIKHAELEYGFTVEIVR